MTSRILVLKEKRGTCNYQRKGPFKRFQHLTNIRSTEVERMLGKC